ncbi:tRNA-Thr(GGU) m(6)t(6)A37 methyltransferase TsaA [Chitinophaga niastensis]|uniref:tRNA-Thr(GGU) m(6)t(6)A37 methyltransferase TsaA n=1 Tax=Chitinophaga niastensis TaxID=536980 RepID=A0A2P8HQ39_CHINA|nr:tRNA (N6-threonylcarbamoyladenosine(37)-N6)-methyltransferase TrmO [Chitinophaga niastensis]PSL48316.1 tRNA-Thr(GGU) m(6)t(6)A37 methyltransferase TsaA [Chitinophaga niastensis]
MEAVIKYIGKIHSSLKKIEECPLQENENAPEAVITIFPEFIEGIQNITVGSEILLLTWLHVANRAVIKCYPRNNQDAPLIGVFSTRSPDRPNPIGIHTVKVLSVSDDGLISVSGLEVIDNTPLIDIKPIWKK